MLLKCFSCLPQVPGDPFLQPPPVTTLGAGGFLSHLPRLCGAAAPVPWRGLDGEWAEGGFGAVSGGCSVRGVGCTPKCKSHLSQAATGMEATMANGRGQLGLLCSCLGDISQAGDTCPVPPSPGVLRLWWDE